MSEDRVATSRRCDASFSDLVARIVDAENEIKAEIERCIDLRIEILGVINKLPDAHERTVLSLRHIEGKPVQEIADIMGYSLRHIRRMFLNAYTDLEKYIPNP